MSKKKFKFEVGEKTRDVWSGDLVSDCVFLATIGQGRMLFYDETFKCFRRVFIEVDPGSGEPYMNGWDCASKPSKLLQS